MTISITDHALLRFLERAKAIDIEQLRVDLEAQLVRGAVAAEALGQGHYTIVLDGFRYVIVDGRCVTIVPKDRPAFRLEEPR